MKKLIIYVCTLICVFSALIGGVIFNSVENNTEENYEVSTLSLPNVANDLFENRRLTSLRRELIEEGDGTEKNPYIITTPGQILDLARGNYYKLGADLNFGMYEYRPDTFRDINFDGNGYSITGVFIGSANNNIGFFRELEDSVITNLHVTGVIRGSGIIGGIAGIISGTQLINCSFSGYIYGEEYVGGLVGQVNDPARNNSEIINCANKANVYGEGDYIGGLVGDVTGSTTAGYEALISNSYNMGIIQGGRANIGGLVGNANNTIVENCYNIGTINAPWYTRADGAIGGIIGLAYECEFRNVYNYGTLSVIAATEAVGGFVGVAKRDNVFENCVNFAEVFCKNEISQSGFVGEPGANNTFTNCYFGGKSTAQSANAEFSISGITRFDGEIMYGDRAFFEDLGLDTFVVDDAVNMGLPYIEEASGLMPLRTTDEREGTWINYIRGNSLSMSELPIGTGTQDDPILIETARQLALIAAEIRDGNDEIASSYFKQMADIDLSGYYWEPTDFSGVYDGNGYFITGVYATSGGVFGRVTPSRGGEIEIPIIQNVNVMNAVYTRGGGGVVGDIDDGFINKCTFQGQFLIRDSGIGGIVYTADNSDVAYCENYGLIYSMGVSAGIAARANGPYKNIYGCANFGSVFSDGHSTGGIVGVSGDVTIENSYNMGLIQGLDGVGGIVGDTDENTILTNVYNGGDIRGTAYRDEFRGNMLGGLVGSAIYEILIENSFNVGSVIGINDYGAFIGRDAGGSIENSYYGGDSPMQGTNLDEMADCYFEDLESAVREKSFLTETFGWDSRLWQTSSDVNDSLPSLRYLEHPECFYGIIYITGVDDCNFVIDYSPKTIVDIGVVNTRYELESYNTEPDGSGTEYTIGQEYPTDTPGLQNPDLPQYTYLYAQWKQVVFNVTLNHGNGTANSTIYVYYGKGFYSNSSATTAITSINLPTEITGQHFAGYYTKTGGAGLQIIDASGKIVGSNTFTNANITLYTYWVYNSYSVKFNGNGATSGSMTNQSFTYGITQALKQNSFVKTGFDFMGWSTSSSGKVEFANGQTVSNLTATNGATVNLYAVWEARNKAKYDEDGGYWYVEMGMFPQSLVTNAPVSTSSAKSGRTYRIGNETLIGYNGTDGKEYCQYNGNWYLVEPVKWRLEGNYSNGYGIENGSVMAITAVVVHASAYSTDEINTENGYVDSAFNNETFYFDSHLYEWSSGETDYLNVSIKKVNYFTPDGTILQDYKLLDIYPSSFEEIVKIFGENYNMQFSDLVTAIIGNILKYWVRDFGSNVNTAQCLTNMGNVLQNCMQNILGVQYTINITEFGCEN